MRHHGITFGYHARNGYLGSPEVREQIDRIAEVGFDWLCLVVTVFQETFASTRQYRDFAFTPGDDEILSLIAHARRRGLKVQLRPMLECLDGTQRIHINFPREREIIPGRPITHWARWFESFIARTRHYARIAEATGCEAYGLDSELDYTVDRQEQWLEVVATARAAFSGHLTTSHTWRVDFLSELKSRPDHWFRSLDSLGCSFYAPLADGPGASVAAMRERARPELEKCREIAALLGKPFYFGEIGCCSTQGAAAKPWGWDNPGGYDGEEQARYAEAVLELFAPEPWWGGFYWWKWDEQNNRPWLRDDPRGDKGFILDGKPAARYLKSWFRRAR